MHWQILGGRSAIRSAKFGVVVFTGSMLDWGGGSASQICHLICLYEL